MPLNDVIERSYSPDQFGERVGWVSVLTQNREEDRPDLVRVDMALGFVGPEGAVVSHVELDNGHEGYHDQSVRGFLGAVAIGGVFVAQEGIQDASQLRLVTSGKHQYDRDPISANYVMRQASGLNSHFYRETQPNEQWVTGTQKFLEVLKQALNEHEGLASYKNLYYLMNVAALHAAFSPNERGIGQMQMNTSLAIPDPSMHELTVTELEQAQKIVDSFERSLTEDGLMQKRLTVFSDIPANQLPQAFTDSRRKMAELEKTAREAAHNGMLARGGVFIPIGDANWRQRSWPYMDPGTSDEQVAFGQELKHLKNGNINPAEYELGREVTELQARVEYARQGANALRMLAKAEEKLATDA